MKFSIVLASLHLHSLIPLVSWQKTNIRLSDIDVSLKIMERSHAATPEIERRISVVKERARAVLSDLPYNLPARLLPWLLYFVVYCLNCIPVNSSGFYVSPRELMTGRKLNYKRDLRFEFGSYIEARNPSGDSSMAGRTNGMIPLLSSGNIQGSVHCFSLETKRVVVRDSWTVLPMPDIVISMLNNLAEEDKQEDRVTRDPEFRVRNKVIQLSADEDKTIEELRREVQQMLTKQVWKPVLWEYLTDEERRSTISSSMFLKEKFTADGKFDKLRARLVAGGHQQDRSVYSDSETSSPTVSITSLFLIAATAAKENRKVVTIDFSGAYINAHIKKKVLMRIDKTLSSVVTDLDPSYLNYVRKDGTLVLQLKRALYGCVESGKLWYDLLSSKLRDFFFLKSLSG